MLDRLPIILTDRFKPRNRSQRAHDSDVYLYEYIDRLVALTGDDDPYVLFMKFAATHSFVRHMDGLIAPVIIDDDITIDPKELQDAMWVSREDVKRALAGDPDAPFVSPPHYAIAHTLLSIWAEQA